MEKKERIIEKLYRGMADLRDYEVNYCIDNNIPFVAKHGIDKMTLSPEDLKTKMVAKSDRLFKSQVGGPDYHLCSYEFIPDKVEL